MAKLKTLARMLDLSFFVKEETIRKTLNEPATASGK